jgi:hypothetical protein
MDMTAVWERGLARAGIGRNGLYILGLLAVFAALATACADSEDTAEVQETSPEPVSTSSSASESAPPSTTLLVPVYDPNAPCSENLPEFPVEEVEDRDVPGRMSVSRRWHTATVLLDGTVMVTGGIARAGHVTASAEIFDPATEKWSVTGNMSDRRLHHRASVLSDGSILVVGGQPSLFDCPVKTADIFDPVAVGWTATSDMHNNRRSHSQVVLRDGRVMVTGGLSHVFGGVIADGEIFDPENGSWTPTEPMLVDRWGHTLTPLSDGRVPAARPAHGHGVIGWPSAGSGRMDRPQ